LPSFPLRYSDPFGSGARPYLALHVTGPSGANGPIVGLLDSGADSTCLPFGYASLMGYQAGDLERLTGMSASGAMDTWRAKKPASAVVVGMSAPTFEINPLFLPNSPNALWGRADLFRVFVVAFDEPNQTFTITTTT
jgi:hypothetical protein